MINPLLKQPIPYRLAPYLLDKVRQQVRQQTHLLRPAASFTIEELTDAYNQTRIDYIVPMPMTAARLQGYIDAYDVDLEASVVALDYQSKEILGLGMLGVRQRRSWVTRLGVLPAARGRRIGQVLMQQLITESQVRHMTHIWLEVIQGNTPAHTLFKKLGFHETRELIVSRRAPGSKSTQSPLLLKKRETLTTEECLHFLNQRPTRPNWLNETETYQNFEQIKGEKYVFADGSSGWVVYVDNRLQIKWVNVGVLHGETASVTAAVLHHLHAQRPLTDAVFENIANTDERWAGYQTAGYFDTFRRIEMVKKL